MSLLLLGNHGLASNETRVPPDLYVYAPVFDVPLAMMQHTVFSRSE